MANNNSGGKGTIVIAVIIIMLILAGIGSCTGGSSDREYKCSSCGKTFTNSADTKSIAYSSMCERCHDNYEFFQDLKEELKQYEENYGN